VKFIKRIKQNWHIKLLSLALAGILWIYVNSIKEKERFLSVPFEVKNVSEGYLVSSELPEFVQLVIRGRDEYLTLINEGDVVAYVDLENNSEGESRKIVKVDRRGLPRGLSIKEITPRLVDVRLDRARRKQVKVVPVIVADLPEGYSFEDVHVDPEEVEIQGPESLLPDIESVYTEEINIRNLTENTVVETEVEIGNEKISLVDDRPVNVRILVKEEFAVKRVSGITIYPVNVNEGLLAEIGDQEVSALVKLPKRLEKEFVDEQVYAYVDCQNITETGDYDLTVWFESDVEEVSLVKLEPATVTVTVTVSVTDILSADSDETPADTD
jgi:YbbR domain-containing protein